MLHREGIAVDENSPEFRALCSSVLKVNIAVFETELKRLKGSVEDTVLPSFASQDSRSHGAQQPKVPRLEQIVEKYLHHNESKGAWNADYIEENHNRLAMFVEWTGNPRLDSITYEMVEDYRNNCLSKLPVRQGGSKKFAGLTLKQLVDLKDIPRISTKTINKAMNIVEAFFGFAHKRGFITVNPAVDLSIPIRVDARDERDAFTSDGLRRVFSLPHYDNQSKLRVDAKVKPYHCHFWIPLLGLYTGARLEELAGLRVEDVKYAEGIHYLQIVPHELRRLKTASSRRIVPLHPFIAKDCKFVDFVSTKPHREGGLVFGELLGLRQNDRLGHIISKWFSRAIRKVGVSESFHSFRHTFISNLFAHPGMDQRTLLSG